jgi:hypothetical protein
MVSRSNKYAIFVKNTRKKYRRICKRTAGPKMFVMILSERRGPVREYEQN